MDKIRESPRLLGLLIGSLTGLLIGLVAGDSLGVGFIFGLVGVLIGYAYEKSAKDGRNPSLDYIEEVLALVSVILTKDKKLLKSELNFVKRFLNHNFSESNAQKYLLVFRDFTKKNLSIPDICKRLNYELDPSGKRQVMHLIIGAAVADRELTTAELKDLYTIGKWLELRRVTIDSLLSLHSFEYEGHQKQQQSRSNYNRTKRQSTSLDHAYKILELKASATKSEIKKAYRKLMVIYHPDKTLRMGEDFQKSAKEKYQKIQNAYEQIKKARNIK